MVSHNWQDASRRNWGTETLSGCTEGFIGVEKINAGSLQRIATAVEKMAQRHTDLIDDLERYKRLYSDARGLCTGYLHQIRGLRGVITKLRKQIKENEANG